MCRLFAQLSVKPESAARGLTEAPHALLPLSRADARRRQKDGWGVAWFVDGRPRVLKSSRPLYEEADRARRAGRRAVSRAVIGHVRAASNPKGLPMGRILGTVNSQPFSAGVWAFAHNGTLQIPDEVAARLGAQRRRLKSRSDSEVFFRQFLKFNAALGDPAEALAACVRETETLWRACRSRHRGKRAPYTGLNAVLSDGRSLHALSLYNGPLGRTRSLGRGVQRWGVMSLRAEPGRVVVASEDLDDGAWRRLPPGTLVSVLPEGRRLRVRLRRLGKGVRKQ
ncbi:MAG: class II glutamine amidotransferase [Elusimicrobia bacterium]|nr:class II glutamine amidotransferase [Elusimicrobiota bacterium]